MTKKPESQICCGCGHWSPIDSGGNQEVRFQHGVCSRIEDLVVETGTPTFKYGFYSVIRHFFNNPIDVLVAGHEPFAHKFNRLVQETFGSQLCRVRTFNRAINKYVSGYQPR